MFEWFMKLFTVRMKSVENPFISASTTQEDPRAMESIKSTRKSFKQQQQSMDMRAMKAHAADCNDTWTCTKDICFVREPDKVTKIDYLSEAEFNRMKATREKNKGILRDMRKPRGPKKRIHSS